MARITGDIVIDRSAEEVFDFVADERNEPSYNPQMLLVEKVSSGPIGSGTQFQALLKSGRRTMPMSLEFTGFERPVRLGSHSSFSGATIDGQLELEPRGEATLLRWTWEVTPQGALRLLGPLLAWIGRRQEQRIWSELKRCLEADVTSPGWSPSRTRGSSQA
jgi:hypothetical protein